jgi:hypothetical protein
VVGKSNVMSATSSDRDQDHLGWSHRVVSDRYERRVYRISAFRYDSPVPRIVRRQNVFVQNIDLDVQVPCLRVGRSSLGVERCRGDAKVPRIPGTVSGRVIPAKVQQGHRCAPRVTRCELKGFKNKLYTTLCFYSSSGTDVRSARAAWKRHQIKRTNDPQQRRL